MESLKIDLSDPVVLDAFSKAGVGDQCVITATVASKDEEGLAASIDTVEYDGYEYEVNEGGDQEAEEPEMPMKMPPGKRPKDKGLMAMGGMGKTK